MIPNLPIMISIAFLAITITALVIFIVSLFNSDKCKDKAVYNITIALTLWLVVQGGISLSGLYFSHLEALPPKIFLYGVFPCVLTILVLFLTKKGRAFVAKIDMRTLVFIHLLRLMIEVVLYWLYIYKTIPVNMTFEGWNYDIVMGLTAPIIIYYGYMLKVLNKKILIGWNILGLAFLGVIFVTAVLSAPTPFQKIGMNQPNIALLHFPFSYLPTFIVPLVVFSHLTAIWQLINDEK